MDKLMLLLIHPFAQDDDGDIVGECTDEQYRLRWAELERLKAILLASGFEGQSRDAGFDVSGCNWEGKMYGEILTITDQNIKLLEGKAAALAALRDRALAKLTPDEQVALGLLKQK